MAKVMVQSINPSPGLAWAAGLCETGDARPCGCTDVGVIVGCWAFPHIELINLCTIKTVLECYRRT